MKRPMCSVAVPNGQRWSMPMRARLGTCARHGWRTEEGGVLRRRATAAAVGLQWAGLQWQDREFEKVVVQRYSGGATAHESARPT